MAFCESTKHFTNDHFINKKPNSKPFKEDQFNWFPLGKMNTFGNNAGAKILFSTHSKETIIKEKFVEQNNNKDAFDSIEENRIDADISAESTDFETCSTKVSIEDVNTYQDDDLEPSHHARRPMNAFLIFCKRHRSIVREKYPHLENRAITKILGEWWASLNKEEKSCYVDLAKQYKDAFFSANPDFKWYKLPAPPLRTLNTRPTNVSNKVTCEKPATSTSPYGQSVFHPGKLADESQLGNLSSLINGRNSMEKNCNENNNNNVSLLNDDRNELSSSPDLLDSQSNDQYYHDSIESSKPDEAVDMTQQQIIDQVVDTMCYDAESTSVDKEFVRKHMSKNPRKSSRSCKGKRYAEFMVRGKLINMKKDRSFIKTKNYDPHEYQKFVQVNELEDTIKKLSERTNIPLPLDDGDSELALINSQSSLEDSSTRRMFQAADFDLDAKIEALPCLSIDKFQERKKEGKKRKITIKNHKATNHNERSLELESNNNSLIGSQKRKARKQQIKRVFDKGAKPKNIADASEDVDLFGLATLADIAAKKPKIDP